MTAEDFKKVMCDFAEKFGKDEADKEDIKKCTGFILAFEEGVFSLMKEPGFLFHELNDDNASIFSYDETYFMWDKIIITDEEFVEWLNKHNFHMVDCAFLIAEIIGDHIVINADFPFSYEKRVGKEPGHPETEYNRDTLNIINKEYEGFREEKNKDEDPEFYYSNVEGVGKIFYDDVTHNITTLNT